MSITDLAEQPDHGLYGVQGFAAITGQYTSVEPGRAILGRILPRQHSAGERGIGDESDTELTTGIENTVGLGLSMQKRVLDLIGGKGYAAVSEGGVGLAHLVPLSSC